MAKILTDEEIIKIGEQAGTIELGENGYALHMHIIFARAIEKSLLGALSEDCESKYKPWSEEDEEELLRFLKDGYKINQIADSLGRTESSTRGRYNLLKKDGKINFPVHGVRSRLSKQEIDEIIKLRKKGLNFKVIASKMERSLSAVKRACFDNCVTAQAWTVDEDKKLRRLVNDGASNNEISERMGRSVYAIRKRRNELSISRHRKKSKSTLKHQPRFKSTGNPWLDILGA